jgi:transposase-like protein
MNANQLFGWRRLYLQGQLKPANREAPGLLAVRVMREAREAARRRNAPATCGTIQIELPKGTVRIVGMPDPNSLHTVLEYLAR